MLLLLIAAGVIVVGGAVAIARLTRQPESVRRVLEAPRLAIAAAPDAPDVRIEGIVELLDSAIEGPLSGARCVYFEYTVAEIEDVGAMHGSSAVGGRVVRRDVDGVPFIIRDASGYAIVDPRGATALLDIDHKADERGDVAGRVLERLIGLPALGGRANGHAERERLIVGGDRIVVIGRGVREPDPDPSTADGLYRDGPATRLRVATSPQFPLNLLDLAHAPVP